MYEYKKEVNFLLKYTLLIDLVLITVFYFYSKLSMELFLGVLVGVIVMISNFIIIVITSINSLKKPPIIASRSVVISYMLRFMAIIVIVSLCFIFGYVNGFIVLLHLVYPKILFSLNILIGKE